MNKKKIIFFSDFGPKKGLGHLFRSISIAESLNEISSFEILFLIESNLYIESVLKQFNYKIIGNLEPIKLYYLYFLNQIIEENPLLFFLDSRLDLPKEFFAKLKNKGIKIVSLDDASDKRFEYDLVFYPPVESAYNLKWDNFKGKYFIGWKWIPLRKEFRNIKKVNYKKTKKDLLIMMGGSDPYNLTSFILKNLNSKIFKTVNLKIILGSSNLFKDEVINLAYNLDQNIKVFEGATNISDIMFQADIAICSFGVTAYELAALNTPSLHICLNDDHIISSKLFTDNNMSFSLGYYKLISSFKLNEYIFKLLKDDLMLTKFRNNCNKYIDASGSLRIASEIKKLL